MGWDSWLGMRASVCVAFAVLITTSCCLGVHVREDPGSGQSVSAVAAPAFPEAAWNYPLPSRGTEPGNVKLGPSSLENGYPVEDWQTREILGNPRRFTDFQMENFRADHGNGQLSIPQPPKDPRAPPAFSAPDYFMPSGSEVFDTRDYSKPPSMMDPRRASFPMPTIRSVEPRTCHELQRGKRWITVKGENLGNGKAGDIVAIHIHLFTRMGKALVRIECVDVTMGAPPDEAPPDAIPNAPAPSSEETVESRGEQGEQEDGSRSETTTEEGDPEEHKEPDTAFGGNGGLHERLMKHAGLSSTQEIAAMLQLAEDPSAGAHDKNKAAGSEVSCRVPEYAGPDGIGFVTIETESMGMSEIPSMDRILPIPQPSSASGSEASSLAPTAAAPERFCCDKCPEPAPPPTPPPLPEITPAPAAPLPDEPPAQPPSPQPPSPQPPSPTVAPVPAPTEHVLPCDFSLSAEHLFGFDSDKPTAEIKAPLEYIVEVLKSAPDIALVISGHTDSKGSAKYNMNLGNRRAKNVLREMKKVAGDAWSSMQERVKAESYGEERPVAANSNDDGTDNPEGRALNRRIEISRTDLDCSGAMGAECPLVRYGDKSWQSSHFSVAALRTRCECGASRSCRFTPAAVELEKFQTGCDKDIRTQLIIPSAECAVSPGFISKEQCVDTPSSLPNLDDIVQHEVEAPTPASLRSNKVPVLGRAGDASTRTKAGYFT